MKNSPQAHQPEEDFLIQEVIIHGDKPERINYDQLPYFSRRSMESFPEGTRISFEIEEGNNGGLESLKPLAVLYLMMRHLENIFLKLGVRVDCKFEVIDEQIQTYLLHEEIRYNIFFELIERSQFLSDAMKNNDATSIVVRFDYKKALIILDSMSSQKYKYQENEELINHAIDRTIIQRLVDDMPKYFHFGVELTTHLKPHPLINLMRSPTPNEEREESKTSSQVQQGVQKYIADITRDNAFLEREYLFGNRQ